MAGSVKRKRLVTVPIFWVFAAVASGKTQPVLLIAGSGTVYPVALKWAQEMGANYSIVDNSGEYTTCAQNRTICEGGSGAGVKRVCAERSDRTHVHIGTISRDFQSSEALRLDDGYTFECSKSKIRVTQVTVAIDGLAVVTAAKGAAASCLLSLTGLTTAQVRWIFTSWNSTMLSTDKDGGVDMASAVPNDNHNGVKEWSDLSAECAQIPVNPYGPGQASGTGAFFGEQVFCKDCFGKKPGRTPEGFPYCNSSQNAILEGLSTIGNITDFITDTSRRKMNCYMATSDDNFDKVSQWVSSDNGGIAFLGFAFYAQNSATVAVARIASDPVKGVQDTGFAPIMPSAYSIIDGSYSVLTRYLFMNIDNEAFPLVLDYLMFGFSEAGMALVAQVGYIKINSALRSQMYQRVKLMGNPKADYVPVPPSNCWNGTRMVDMPYMNAFGNPKVKYICQPCQPGRAKADNLPVDCRACDEGSFAAGEGQSQCEFCEQGSAAAAGASSCTACPKNTYAAMPGQAVCNPCDPGFFASELASAACNRCPLGTYRSVDHTKCMECPTGMTTEFLGATKMEDCACAEGSFLAKNGTINGPCLPCPPGLKCPFGSKNDNFALAAIDPTKVAPMLPINFWSDPAEPTSVFACRIDEPSCPGGLPGQCKGGLIGRVCAICPDGKNPADGRCQDCQQGMSGVGYLMLIGLTAVVIVSYYVGNSLITSNLTIINAASTLLSQFLTIIQILSMFSNLNVSWPVHVSDLFSGLSISLGSGKIPYSCFLGSPAEMRYGFRLALPIVFVVVVLLIFLCSKLLSLFRASLAWEIDPTLNTAGQLLQAVFISIAAIVVVPFQCYPHPNGSKSIALFPEVLCFEGGVHSMMLACGIVLGLTFVLPFLLWCIYGSCAVVRGNSKQQRLRSRRRFRFLLFRFRTDVWWWGTVLMFRQLLLAFAPSLPSDKAHVQSIYVVFVLTVYGMVQAHYWPWKAPEFNFLDSTISIGLIAVVVIATSFLKASNDGNTYETLLFVVLIGIGLFVGLLMCRIAMHVVQGKGTFGPDAHPLSEKRALEVFDQIEQISNRGGNAFVANAQKMNHYDTITMLKGIDVYAVVAKHVTLGGASSRLTGIEMSSSGQSSQGRMGNLAGKTHGAEIIDTEGDKDNISVQVLKDQLVVM